MSQQSQLNSIDPHALADAQSALDECDALVITAGAGMGVDSGLPDFRGDAGFWKAYPAYGRLGLPFASLANPKWFREDPTLAWGFYGHRLGLYRSTTPHRGFGLLKRFSESRPLGCFVFTSNVDGGFQRAGFSPDSVCEAHGSISHLQCLEGCGVGVFEAGPGLRVEVDPVEFRAVGPLPKCPSCGGLARPNILMFGDGEWDRSRTAAQRERLWGWISRAAGGRVCVVECGAGAAVATVRDFSEQIFRGLEASLVRINPRDVDVPPGGISLPMGALAGLTALLDV